MGQPRGCGGRCARPPAAGVPDGLGRHGSRRDAELVGQRPGGIEDLVTEFGRLHRPAPQGAHQQRAAHVLLKASEVIGDAVRGQAERRTRVAEGAVPGDLEEGPQPAQLVVVAEGRLQDRGDVLDAEGGAAEVPVALPRNAMTPGPARHRPWCHAQFPADVLEGPVSVDVLRVQPAAVEEFCGAGCAIGPARPCAVARQTVLFGESGDVLAVEPCLFGDLHEGGVLVHVEPLQDVAGELRARDLHAGEGGLAGPAIARPTPASRPRPGSGPAGGRRAGRGVLGEYEPEGAHVGVQSPGDVQWSMPRADVAVQVGQVEAFGIGSGEVEAGEKFGGRFPGQRLLGDALAGEEDRSDRIEFGEELRGEQVGEPVARIAERGRVVRKFGQLVCGQSADPLEEEAAGDVVAATVPRRLLRPRARCLPAILRQEFGVVEATAPGVVDGDLVSVEVLGQPDQGHLDVVPLRGVAQGLQGVRGDGLVDQPAQVLGDDGGELGPAVHEHQRGRQRGSQMFTHLRGRIEAGYPARPEHRRGLDRAARHRLQVGRRAAGPGGGRSIAQLVHRAQGRADGRHVHGLQPRAGIPRPRAGHRGADEVAAFRRSVQQEPHPRRRLLAVVLPEDAPRRGDERGRAGGRHRHEAAGRTLAGRRLLAGLEEVGRHELGQLVAGHDEQGPPAKPFDVGQDVEGGLGPVPVDAEGADAGGDGIHEVLLRPQSRVIQVEEQGVGGVQWVPAARAGAAVRFRAGAIAQAGRRDDAVGVPLPSLQ